MKTFTVIIKSKNKTSKDNFLVTFKKIILSQSFSIRKQFSKKVKKKKITILKSPHVNKSAQEQFETQFFCTQFTIRSIKIFKYLILLKKLNFNVFSDIHIILRYDIKKENSSKLNFKIFIPENFEIEKFSKDKNFNFELELLKKENTFSKLLINRKISLLLKILDISGELIKHMFE